MIHITDKEFKEFSSLIKMNYGIHLKQEKKILVEGRLQKRLDELGLISFSEYYEYIMADGTGMAMNDMVDKITTNHTYFMREREHFDYLKQVVLPYLSASVKQKDLGIWSAASSSGEEPYTIAMIIDEYFGLQKHEWDTKILATDISDKVLTQARAGVYSTQKIESLPTLWKSKYFISIDSENYRISDQLRQEVIFRKFNLMTQIYPFKRKFHIIFCRNVMIYFDQNTKNELINRMYDCLEPGGYLFIGHSESVDRTKSRFQYVMPSVYRKER